MENVDASLVALALSIAFFVNTGVDIVKRILGRSRKRRWALPLAGLIYGWLFAGLLLVYRQQAFTWSATAGVILVGFLACGLAVLQNDQSKNAEEATRA